ncbi:MAG TPA: integrase arm-type DNA-binding domain-containing protein [Burkholderiaceae bacterium]|nr:integrase arm-type DNA-binding domain-containing protein [Burkholderiaceae bacterium]
MPKVADALSAIEVKRLTDPGTYRVGTVPGLMLRIGDSGGKYWLLRTTVQGKRTDIGVGTYPEVSLADAIKQAREQKAKIKDGINPVAERIKPALAAKQTFKAVAAAYIDSHRAGWKNPKHEQQWANTLETYAHPFIGDKHVGDVTVADVLALLKPIWSTKNETATRVRNRVELVLGYGMALGYTPRGLNPAAWRGNLDNLLPKPSKVATVDHHPAVDYKAANAFLMRLKSMPGMGARCLEFTMLTACRSGESRLAVWNEFDLEGKVWNIPAERMKAGRPHRVPLSEPVLALLKALPRIEGEVLVFPGTKPNKPLSDMTLTACMRRLNVDAVPHGLRSTFRDWAAECTSFPNEVAEMALAHAVGNATEAAYRRGDLFTKRVELMDAWAVYLTKDPSAKVIPLRKVV